MRGRSVAVSTVMAVELQDDVARLHARPCRLGRPASTLPTSAPCAFGKPSESATSFGHLADRHGDPAAHDLARRLQLIGDAHRLVDRNRERNAHETAGAAVDLRVDADHLALHVDERPAGVARVDRHVGLDERQIVARVAPLRADDAGRHRVVEAERRADRDAPTRPTRTLFESPIVMVGRFEALIFTTATSGSIVDADELSLEFALVGAA